MVLFAFYVVIILVSVDKILLCYQLGEISSAQYLSWCHLFVGSLLKLKFSNLLLLRLLGF